MKLYLETKSMTLEDRKHEIILKASDKEFLGYDRTVNSNILSKNEYGIYIVREQKTWWSFPLYEFKDDKIALFNYAKYNYFANTDRRMALSLKISELYNHSSEFKILRKTFKYIMDTLKIPYPDFFRKYNDKIESLINKIPKN